VSLLQWMKPYLPTKQSCFWVQLSAKVGSISDNQLGGWYSYRASKAALNMLLKTAAIELARSHKQLTIAAIHPGTTDTQLSKPFQGRLSADKLFTPAMSAARIAQVIDSLEPAMSGALWHWDGTRLPY
jgi:NAD(P)-dependent dehydrogenase (short-subunit alcohol dehydrogenase family)